MKVKYRHRRYSNITVGYFNLITQRIAGFKYTCTFLHFQHVSLPLIRIAPAFKFQSSGDLFLDANFPQLLRIISAHNNLIFILFLPTTIPPITLHVIYPSLLCKSPTRHPLTVRATHRLLCTCKFLLVIWGLNKPGPKSYKDIICIRPNVFKLFSLRPSSQFLKNFHPLLFCNANKQQFYSLSNYH